MEVYKLNTKDLDRNEFVNLALRILDNKVYFFNYKFIYTCVRYDMAVCLGIKGVNKYYVTRKFERNEYYKLKSFKRGDIRIIKKIAPQLNVGDNFERFIELANKTEIKASIKEEDKIEEIVKNKGEIWLFITKIYKPKIYREYGNNNKDTFDFIV